MSENPKRYRQSEFIRLRIRECYKDFPKKAAKSNFKKHLDKFYELSIDVFVLILCIPAFITLIILSFFLI